MCWAWSSCPEQSNRLATIMGLHHLSLLHHPSTCASSQVFPVVREHCGAEEQRQLVYRSLLVMPLRLLEQVLPWLMTLLTEEEAEDMRHNMRLAGKPSWVPIRPCSACMRVLQRSCWL